MFNRGGNFAFLSNEAKSSKTFEVKVLKKTSRTKSVKVTGFWVMTPYSVVYNVSISEKVEAFTWTKVSQSEDEGSRCLRNVGTNYPLDGITSQRLRFNNRAVAFMYSRTLFWTDGDQSFFHKQILFGRLLKRFIYMIKNKVFFKTSYNSAIRYLLFLIVTFFWPIYAEADARIAPPTPVVHFGANDSIVCAFHRI